MSDVTPTSRFAIATCIKDGQLEFGQVAARRDFVDSVDLAIHRLLAGEDVWVVQNAGVVNSVQRTIEAVLARLLQ